MFNDFVLFKGLQLSIIAFPSYSFFFVFVYKFAVLIRHGRWKNFLADIQNSVPRIWMSELSDVGNVFLLPKNILQLPIVIMGTLKSGHHSVSFGGLCFDLMANSQN